MQNNQNNASNSSATSRSDSDGQSASADQSFYSSIDAKINADFEKSQAKNRRRNLIVILVVALIFFGLQFQDYKRYGIEVLPQTLADKALVSRLSGLGLYYDGRLYTLGGDVKLNISAKFFKPMDIEVTKDSPSTVVVTLQPIALQLKASTNVDSAEIRWYLDDKLVHTGKALYQELAAGQYQLKVDSPLHESEQRKITIGDEPITNVSFELKPIQGELKVQTIPTDALVSINGKPVGQSPLSVPLEAGTHRIEVSKAGFEPASAEVQISKEEKTQSKTFELGGVKGYLDITLNPKGGTLTVDGRSSGAGKIKVQPNKPVVLIYQAPGYLSDKKTLSVEANETENVAFDLKAELGEVLLKGSPAAEIYIDGEKIGVGSVSKMLPTKRHTVEFKQAGYRSQSRQFTPSAKRRLEISVKLIAEASEKVAAEKPAEQTTQAAPQSSKATSDTLGFSLVRVNMKPFTMGSPANERGRTPDEYEYQASFSKTVLIGRHEVTEAQYSAFDPSRASSNNPVTNVSWNDAALFCNWLSESDGLAAFYQVQGRTVTGFNPDSNGYRLPTEAEWEWLAKLSQRAAQTTYAWGGQEFIPENFANLGAIAGYSDPYPGVAPVGSFSAERIGIFDLTGNVSEWVHDYYTFKTPKKSVRDYMGDSSGSAHLYKGGNYQSSNLEDLRAAKRTKASSGSPTVGFRIARYQ